MPDHVPAPPDVEELCRVLDRYGPTLLSTAAASIDHGLSQGGPLDVAAADFDDALRAPRATFVTLQRHGSLRGCIGSAEAYRPLIEDVAANAFAAAFRDSRFPPLTLAERDGLEISVSVLSPPEPLRFADNDDLVRLLRPGVDGLILQYGHRRALFLPQVWAALPAPAMFVAELKRKAGIHDPVDAARLKASRFLACSLSSTAPTLVRPEP
ncbi:MAG: AmmeMemoRadiSam system protein A [Rhodospirillales bacterium]